MYQSSTKSWNIGSSRIDIENQIKDFHELFLFDPLVSNSIYGSIEALTQNVFEEKV